MVVPISGPSECASPRCKKELEIPGAHSNSRVQACPHHQTTHARVCECEDEDAKMVHEKILNCISKIEHSFHELCVARGVTMHLSEEVNTTRVVDPAVPTKEMRGMLNVLSKSIMDFKLDNDK